MINLFKKNIHSFLSFTTTDTCHDPHPHHFSISGLGLVTATTNVDRPPNVLESAMLRPSGTNTPPPSTSSPTGEKRVIGFADDVGVDGLKSCTESLGFESSDEIHSKNNGGGDDDDDDDEIWRRRMMRAEGRGNWKKVRSFPPPLPSLNRNGKPSFYLRPVRKDGRLELTEVRIEQSEILHASRHNGRLTLRLIPDYESVVEDEEDEVEVEEEEEVEEWVGEWRFRAEGLRKCHEMVNHHHNHSRRHHHHVHGNLRMCEIGIV
ncbi:uncharacterized protein LOC113861147 [Abrus precatorius]|uniref:Uncharacterized protein LOC113861147 n=1 Tax=Abrus precatorius TaxID=3816 RepID=A0A8B8L067_ABRPR|nr:uncharacterized protein LOC113861147 [Abrus precatorius]